MCVFCPLRGGKSFAETASEATKYGVSDFWQLNEQFVPYPWMEFVHPKNGQLYFYNFKVRARGTQLCFTASALCRIMSSYVHGSGARLSSVGQSQRDDVFYSVCVVFDRQIAVRSFFISPLTSIPRVRFFF